MADIKAKHQPQAITGGLAAAACRMQPPNRSEILLQHQNGSQLLCRLVQFK